MRNQIIEALCNGKRARMISWPAGNWIRKTDDNMLTCQGGMKHGWVYNFAPNLWEILDDEPTQTDLPSDIYNAIDLLKANGYEIYKVTKTQI